MTRIQKYVVESLERMALVFEEGRHDYGLCGEVWKSTYGFDDIQDRTVVENIITDMIEEYGPPDEEKVTYSGIAGEFCRYFAAVRPNEPDIPRATFALLLIEVYLTDHVERTDD